MHVLSLIQEVFSQCALESTGAAGMTADRRRFGCFLPIGMGLALYSKETSGYPKFKGLQELEVKFIHHYLTTTVGTYVP